MDNKKIIFNWKMQGNLEYCDQIKSRFKKFNNNFDFIICPPSPLFFKFNCAENENFPNIFLGSQNCANSAENNYENNYTGEIPISLLKEFNIQYSIIGHSERRKYFFENDCFVTQKMENLLNSGLTPIICVKKFFEDKEYIKNIIGTFSRFDFPSKNLIIAYEPLSAIGTGIAENIYSIEENLLQIKNLINFEALKENGKNISIVYGGSVQAENIDEILKVSSGVLIGKASTSLEKFDLIIEKLSNAQASC